jgi:Tfp pilus assembly protein PilP
VKTRILALVVLAGLAAPAYAQIPVGTKVGEPITGYDSGGRRDPFTSLIVARRPTPGQPVTGRSHGTGLTSFSVSDVMVTGIVSSGTARMAILQGPDKTSYVAKVGARIMDATIKSIDAHGVVFVELMEPGNTARPQEYRKTLRPAAEVNR